MRLFFSVQVIPQLPVSLFAAENLVNLAAQKALPILVPIAMDRRAKDGRRVSAARMLGKIEGARKGAEKAWIALAHDIKIDIQYRLEAAENLLNLAPRKVSPILVPIAVDTGAEASDRVSAARILHNLGNIKGAVKGAEKAWIALAHDNGIDPKYRLEAARSLEDISGQLVEVMKAWLRIASDADRDILYEEWIHEQYLAASSHFQSLLSALSQAEVLSILTQLLRDAKLGMHVRILAFRYLYNSIQSGKVPHALQKIAIDKRVDIRIRKRAAQKLGMLGRNHKAMEAWSAIACSEKLDIKEREQIARMLERSGKVEEAIQVYLSLVYDKSLYVWTRIRAAESLHRHRRFDEATEAWLALARDESVDKWRRSDAVMMLINLGRINELLILLRDQTVWLIVRIQAAKALGRFADPTILGDLENIAREDPDEDVRWATEQAIKQIRNT